MQSGSELGEVDQAEVVKTFTRLTDTFASCHKEGLARIENLQGDLKFFLRLGKDGFVRWVYLEESSLGDYETEKCILDAIRGTRWPRPDEGEAEVRSGASFDAPNVRMPIAWGADRLSAVIAKQAKVVEKCKKNGKIGVFHVTAYVKARGKRGRVQAVGVAAPRRDAEAASECIVRAVRSWEVPSPGARGAKVSFDL